MNKEELDAMKWLETKCYVESPQYEEFEKCVNVIKQTLQRLETIENAKPSVVLKFIEGLLKRYEDKTDYNIYITKEWLLEIKQALLKAQEQEKVLEIIKEYQVDIWLLKQCDYENYIRIRKEAMVSVGQIINENGIILEDEITKEEFELLKEML